jgi:hypothetical protein
MIERCRRISAEWRFKKGFSSEGWKEEEEPEEMAKERSNMFSAHREVLEV